jgi:hypothetical protein
LSIRLQVLLDIVLNCRCYKEEKRERRRKRKIYYHASPKSKCVAHQNKLAETHSETPKKVVVRRRRKLHTPLETFFVFYYLP